MYIKGVSEKISIFQYIQHISIAFFISATVMSMVIPRANIFIYTSAGSLAVFLLSSRFRSLKQISFIQIGISLFLCILFALSSIPISGGLGHAELERYFQFFLITGIGSLLVANFEYNFEALLRAFILIGLVLSPIIINTNYSTLLYDVDNDEWMAKIYAILPYIVASFYYLFEGKKIIFKLLSIACILLYSSMVIMHTPRGAVVTILASILVFFYQRMSIKGVRRSRLVIYGIVSIAIVFIFSNVILEFLNTIADEYELRWLLKFVASDDVSNNRSPLYAEAIQGFIDSPIWGNGIAKFHNYQTYPHNIFLEMMYETGIIMLVPFSFYLFKAASMIIKCKSHKYIDYRLVTFLFLISIIKLLFSSFFWREPAYWMLMWMVISIVHPSNSLAQTKDNKYNYSNENYFNSSSQIPGKTSCN